MSKENLSRILTLRSLRNGDAIDVFNSFANLCIFNGSLPLVKPIDVYGAEQFIKHVNFQPTKGLPSRTVFGVTENGRVVGVVGLYNIAIDQSAELSFWMMRKKCPPDLYDRLIINPVISIVRKVVRLAFNLYNVEDLISIVLVRNYNARDILVENGFIMNKVISPNYKIGETNEEFSVAKIDSHSIKRRI